MSERPDGDENAWEEMLRSVMGPELAQDAIEAMRSAGLDPSTMANAAGLPRDRNELTLMISQIQRMLATGGGGPVNWRLAEDLARQVTTANGDPLVTAEQGTHVTSALQVADLWLDAVTDLPPAGAAPRAWRRSEWAERTLPTWKKLAEPVASSVSGALEHVLEDQAEHLPEDVGPLHAQLGAAGGMIRQLGGAVFGMQVGQAVGTLAGEAFGPTEAGLPLLEEATVALVPANVDAFAQGLDVPISEIRHFLAVREVAHARLFAGVPWLRSYLISAVQEYAAEITIDVGAMEEAVRDLDVTDPEKLREAFSGGVFALEHSQAQQAALTKLETALALVEGWVEEITAQAVAPHLPHAVPLREMMRRRRAAGGPADQTFTTLVGLELRPRRIREAATLWSTLGSERGQEARDALWSHPDLMPSPEELDRPEDFVTSRDAAAKAEEEVDAALASILAAAEIETSEDLTPGDSRDTGDAAGPGASPAGTDGGSADPAVGDSARDDSPNSDSPNSDSPGSDSPNGESPDSDGPHAG